ncbi:MAG: hypothetical protein K2M12_06490, partial [Muribaculaceae bacterium]|nr:hypothetical protein [Muribaculaceae bacterium]
MKRLSVLITAAMASGMLAAGQINSSASVGYLTRGMQMLESKNYNGCIDQLRHIDRGSLSAAELEQVDWSLAEAAFGQSGAASLPHFRRFLAVYP